MLAVLALAAASGYPNQLTESALQAWLKDSGASNTTIGLMSYVALPYLLKPLWAPLVDRFPVPLLGRRRGWILLSQVAIAAMLAVLALQQPALGLDAVALCALGIVFCSATQDIAFDAWRTDVSAPPERGMAAAATNIGYRSAAFLAGALALIAADWIGWQRAYLILAAGMLPFALATALAPEPTYVQGPPRSLRQSLLEPLRELFGSPGAASLIAVVLLFKIGDAFANKLFTPFMLDTGFTKTEIGLIAKSLFTASAIGGGILGGLAMARIGLTRSMLLFGVAQAVSNLLYCLLAASGRNWPVMIGAVVIEHVAGAMGNIALVALIMALCDVRFSAFQYALLSAIALLPRYGLGGPAGWVADHAGWYVYYVVSAGLALPGLAIVWWRRRAIDALDARAQ